MRKVESTQLELGSADIGAVHINPKSRDDIPALLRGLQHLYVTAQLRQQVFALLEAEVNPNARKDTGRPGMHLWRCQCSPPISSGWGGFCATKSAKDSPAASTSKPLRTPTSTICMDHPLGGDFVVGEIRSFLIISTTSLKNPLCGR